MVGILLVTHNGLGDSLLDCVRHVSGGIPPHLKALSVLADDNPQLKEEEGRALLTQLNSGDGVLILTDMYGATPSNIALRLCQQQEVAGVAGVNLPMLLRVVCGPDMPLNTMVQRALDGGRDCIVPLHTELHDAQAAVQQCQGVK